MSTPSFLWNKLAGHTSHTILAQLNDLEARLNALPKNAGWCTLYSVDLVVLGINANHKRRRSIAWTRRKVEEVRMRRVAEVARALTK